MKLVRQFAILMVLQMTVNMSVQEDLERLMPHIESAIHRVPAFAEVGVKKVYNGAIAYTPDGSPIIGPAWDLPNFWRMRAIASVSRQRGCWLAAR